MITCMCELFSATLALRARMRRAALFAAAGVVCSAQSYPYPCTFSSPAQKTVRKYSLFVGRSSHDHLPAATATDLSPGTLPPQANSICPAYGQPCGTAPGMFLCGRGAYCRATLSGAGGTFSGVCDTQPPLPAVRALLLLRAAQPGAQRRMPCAACCATSSAAAFLRAGLRQAVHAGQRHSGLRV